MTEPADPRPNPEHLPGEDGADALDDATVAALRALLRDEPVADDDLARERRIRAALDAAPAAVPAPRRRTGGAGWLVAAAVVAVLGVGGYLFVSVAGSGSSDESASTEMAEVERPDSGGEESGVADSDGTGGVDTAAEPTERGGETGRPSSGAPPAAEAAVPVAELGTFDDLDALLAVARAAGDETAVQSGTAEPMDLGEAMPCVEQQQAFGVQVVGVATLEGRAVVVVDGPVGPTVLEAAGCTDWPG